jgi:hypothetical protein
VSGDLKTDLQSGLQSVAKGWKKAKRREDRISRAALNRMRYAPPRETIRDAAFDVMEEAYNHASSNGKYVTVARQIMYAARPLVLKMTGGEIWTHSSYFTQLLLKDYLELHRPDWRIVWDARGRLREPHTGRLVDLGGISLDRYTGKWTSESFPVTPVATIKARIETTGPALRYGAALFIEKEGFDQILTDAGIAERYDLAVFSSKGVPVQATCEMARLLNEADVPVLAVRDFDYAGFKIVRTLRCGTRLHDGADIIELGFRLEDVDGLASESVTYKQKKDPRHYLREAGATEAEAEFLVSGGGGRQRWHGQRVELNAMTSEQFIGWLERKLDEHGVEKLVPTTDILADAYRRGVYRYELQRAAMQVMERLPETDIPDDLETQVRDCLAESPRTSWDEAVSQIAEEDQEQSEDNEHD